MTSSKTPQGPDNDNSKTGACPICNSPATADYAPFCSKRCADVDLHRWLAGAYAIPAGEDESEGVDDES